MTQITVRKLDPATIESLKRRAAASGHSMEEEVRKIINDAVGDDQLRRQRIWLKEMQELRQQIFGAKVLPDSTPIIRRMRADRTRQQDAWALPSRKKKK
jgi:plasmid stability protein